jgi:2-phospho-L-lactate/phosphoenolpyruvate guanylyltransferase
VTAIVVPFSGAGGKQRLDVPAGVRASLALAMLGDVVTACVVAGPTVVVTSDADGAALARELGARVFADPGGGQAAAVAAALTTVEEGPVLVVNADLPCVVPHDLRTLAGAAELGAFGFVAAQDGTTNALALPSPAAFAPLYGPGSAERFRAHAAAAGLDAMPAAIPNLVDDVDTLADLAGVTLRAGPRTQAVAGELNWGSA